MKLDMKLQVGMICSLLQEGVGRETACEGATRLSEFWKRWDSVTTTSLWAWPWLHLHTGPTYFTHSLSESSLLLVSCPCSVYICSCVFKFMHLCMWNAKLAISEFCKGEIKTFSLVFMKTIAMLFCTTQIINISKNFETWPLAYKPFSLRNTSTAPIGEKSCLDDI